MTEYSLKEFQSEMQQLKYWRTTARAQAQALRQIKKDYAKRVEALENELVTKKIECLYWREIALENQTNG